MKTYKKNTLRRKNLKTKKKNNSQTGSGLFSRFFPKKCIINLTDIENYGSDYYNIIKNYYTLYGPKGNQPIKGTSLEIYNTFSSRDIKNLENLNYGEEINITIGNAFNNALFTAATEPNDKEKSDIYRLNPLSTKPHFLSVENIKYENISLIPPEIILSYYLIKTLKETNLLDKYIRNPSLTSPRHGNDVNLTLKDNIIRRYKEKQIEDYGMILPEIMFKKVESMFELLSREIELNNIFIDNTVRRDKLIPTTVNPPGFENIFHPDNIRSLCAEIDEDFSGHTAKSKNLCILLNTIGGRLFFSLNRLYNQINPNFIEYNNIILTSVYDELYNMERWNMNEKLNRLNFLLNQFKIKKFYKYDLIILLSLLSNAPVYAGPFQVGISTAINSQLNELNSRQSEGFYNCMLTSSNTYKGDNIYSNYITNNIVSINKLFPENIENYLYNVNCYIQLIKTREDIDSSNIIIYKKSSMFLTLSNQSNEGDRFLLAIMTMTEIINVENEEYSLVNTIRWVINQENRNRLMQIGGYEAFPFLKCIKPIDMTEPNLQPPQQGLQQAPQQGLQQGPQQGLQQAPQQAPQQGPTQAIQTETEQNSYFKDRIDKLKTVARDAYNNVQEKPESALALATTVSAAVALPIILTLAGGGRSLKREKKNKSRKNKKSRKI